MFSKKKLITSLCIASILCVTGCGDPIPTLTANENHAIAEYAAGLLLKYDAHHVNRLVSDEVIEKAYAEAYRQAEVAYKVELYRQQVAAAESEKKNKKDKDSSSSSGSAETKEEVFYTLPQILGLDGVMDFTYTNVEVCQTYPSPDSEDFFVAMDASAGNELVVVHYNMKNISGEDVHLDILSKKPSFLLMTSDGKKHLCQATLLFDDLTQYLADVEADSEQIVSIIFEVPSEEIQNADSLTLKGKCDGKSFQITL